MGKILKKAEKGAASNYITRAQAIRKLQLSLSDFRRICIIKGIYPHEPKNKKKVGKGSTAPRTHYFKKDIQYLLHEPILQKFRDIKAHQRKLYKAVTKREWSVAKNLESLTPKYTLDHVIRERYPSFADALRDLDDALSMIFLFANLPSDGIIKPSRIRNCQKLASEFQHYVMASKSLSKVFLSIKGIYYQAQVHGQDITWIVPYQFSFQVPSDVDLKIMSTFLELYETLLGFVNYKLYSELNFAYPPKVDETQDASGAGLAAYVMESADGKELLDNLSAANGAGKGKDAKRKIQRRLKTLSSKIEGIQEGQDEDDNMDDAENEEPNTDDLGVPKAVSDPTDITEQLPSLDDESIQDTEKHKTLLKDLVFFLSREVPRNSLEFIIRSFGGKVGWDASSGSGSEYEESDPRITHYIIDRPVTESSTVHEKREYLQPQWVYDCVNAKRLLKTKGYHPGEELPPHISPFGNGAEGYDPLEKLDTEIGDSEKAEDEADDIAGDEEEDDEDDEDENDDEFEDDDEEAIYKAELAAEAAGMSFSEYMEKKAKEEDATGKTSKSSTSEAPKKRKASQAELEAAEEKELAKMMMSKKDRRLYNQIEFGKKKKEAEANKLREKRIELEKAAKKQKTVAAKALVEEASSPTATKPVEKHVPSPEPTITEPNSKKKKNKAEKAEAPAPSPEKPISTATEAKEKAKAAKTVETTSSPEKPEPAAPELKGKKNKAKAAKAEAPAPAPEKLAAPEPKGKGKASKAESTSKPQEEATEPAQAKKQVKWAKQDQLRLIAEYDKHESPEKGVRRPEDIAKAKAAGSKLAIAAAQKQSAKAGEQKLHTASKAGVLKKSKAPVTSIKSAGTGGFLVKKKAPASK
ncbi:mRNA-binding ribosome synthesis protein nop7 [Dinochytrium kinnereticum]|nr:mRNA-binding ribosome synthesis protein nop7 [Dinochytrium kinnereticum]